MGSAAWEFWLATYVTGTAAASFSASVAATGSETVSASGALAFGFSESATGAETFTGTGAVAFTSSESETGAETFTGTAALSFTYSESLVGALPAEGMGAVSFGWSASGTDSVSIDPGVLGTPRKTNPHQHLDTIEIRDGSGGVTFGHSTRGDGLVEDEAAFLLLLAA